MTGTCDTCKSWDDTANSTMESQFGDVNYRKCKCPKIDYIDDEGFVPDPDGAGYWDSESYSATLTTGPKFGCVHWVAKIQIKKS